MIDNHNKYELKISDSIYLETFSVNNKNRISLLFMLVSAIIIFLLPIFVFIFLFTDFEGIPFGILISFILSGLVSVFFLRLYLWNKYGKEVFVIKDNSFTYYYDYKLFKDYHKEITFKTINTYFLFNDGFRNTADIWYSTQTEKKMEYLMATESPIFFELDGNPDIISSKRELPISAIVDIGRKLGLKSYYNNINKEKSNI